MNKRKIFTILFCALTVLFAVGAWFAVWRAILIPDSSAWLVPMILFSLYVICACFSIILAKDLLLLEFSLLSSLAASIFFAPSLWQVLAIIFGGYFLFTASRLIRRDFELNVAISPWKSLRAGKSYLLVAITLVICVQYFLTIRKIDGQINIPKFDITPISKQIVMPILVSFNPTLRSLNDETMTVDQFILQSQKDVLEDQSQNLDDSFLDAQLPSDITEQEKKFLKKQAKENFDKSKKQIASKNQELVLQMGHKEFSDMLGIPIYGDEKVTEVFAGLVDRKLNDFFSSPVGGVQKNQLLPIILTVILFLTIYPIASVLSIGCFLIVKSGIFLMIHFGVLKVKKIQVMKEIFE